MNPSSEPVTPRVGTGGCTAPHPHFGVPCSVSPVLEPLSTACVAAAPLGGPSTHLLPAGLASPSRSLFPGNPIPRGARLGPGIAPRGCGCPRPFCAAFGGAGGSGAAPAGSGPRPIPGPAIPPRVPPPCHRPRPSGGPGGSISPQGGPGAGLSVPSPPRRDPGPPALPRDTRPGPPCGESCGQGSVPAAGRAVNSCFQGNAGGN